MHRIYCQSRVVSDNHILCKRNRPTDGFDWTPVFIERVAEYKCLTAHVFAEGEADNPFQHVRGLIFALLVVKPNDRYAEYATAGFNHLTVQRINTVIYDAGICVPGKTGHVWNM